MRLILSALCAASLWCAGPEAQAKKPRSLGFNTFYVDPKERVEFHGQVVDAQGAGVGGARRLLARWFQHRFAPERADAEGRFTIKLPKASFPHTIYAIDPTRVGFGEAPTVEDNAQASRDTHQAGGYEGA